MKKLIIIALLVIVLSASLSATSVCFADETSTSEFYYFESTQTSPNLALRSTAADGNNILVYIPHSYAFEKLAEPDGEFVKVRYNGLEGYIQTALFSGNCKAVNANWGNNDKAFAITNLTITSNQVTLYNESLTSEDSVDKSKLTITKVYGYRNTIDYEYYFYVEAIVKFMGEDLPATKAHIKASDTSLAAFEKNSVPVNAGYSAQIAAARPNSTPNGDTESGDNNTTVDNKSNTQVPKNSLDRYILIAVIAVLCVVIIILIFLPNKKRQH